ncbi:MAG: hypothetical protein IKI24_02420 [Clostridia bacterium]|nr:hypothetical protein [Clostridia bacterium]
MLYTALDMGISAVEFWDEFTPRAILILARTRKRLENRTDARAGGRRKPDKGPMPKINRIPR